MKQYKLFFSWQNDRKDIKRIISAALSKAVKRFAKEGIELVIDQDTRGRVGKRNITTEVLDKICNCDIFLADLTPITTYRPTEEHSIPKHMPNSNVMYEYGYALHAKGEQRMIALASLNKEQGEHIEHMPFDINHDTITTFTDNESLRNLYLWIKNIMEHVDAERGTHLPQFGCSLYFETEEGYTIESTIYPCYKCIQYVPKCSSIQETAPTTSPAWFDSIKSIHHDFSRFSGCLAPFQNAALVRAKTNLSYVPIQLLFSNNGSEPLDNLEVRIMASDERVSFAETNVKDSFSLSGLHGITGTSISEMGIVHNTHTVNPQASFALETIYVHVPHDIENFSLCWTMNSRKYRAEGMLSIHVIPEFKYENIENDLLAGTEEIHDYEEA